MTSPTHSWLCRWDGGELLVHGGSIEQARLEARRYAGPHIPVHARLATRHEQADPTLNQRDDRAS